MNKKLFKLCILGCAAFAMNACDTGEYKDLECDESYVAECLSTGALMRCDSNKLIVEYCAEGSSCKHINGVSRCSADGEGSSETAACTTKCIDGQRLSRCNADGTTTTIDCTTTNQVCEVDVCVTRPSTPQTCEVKCVDSTTLSDCVDNVATTKDCSTENKICGTDESGKAACIDASTPETCTESVCDTDGKLKVCVIADGETEGTFDDPIDCSKDESGEDTGLECGKDENDKFACVPKVTKCTESVCDASGKLKVCVIADGETEGTFDDPFDCSKNEQGQDTGLVCGMDENSKAACVQGEVKCEETVCAEDGITLNICNDENEVEPFDCSKNSDGSDSGKICGENSEGKAACIDKPEECTANACDEDGITLKVCEIKTGETKGVVVETKNCAVDSEGAATNLVCGEKQVDSAVTFDCVPEKCETSTCEDGEVFVRCTDGAVESRTTCAGETPICANELDLRYLNDGKDATDADYATTSCIAKFDASLLECSKDSTTLWTADATSGHIVDSVCANEDNDFMSQCKVADVSGTPTPKCLAPEEVKSAVGLPCSCDESDPDNDCYTTVTGDEIIKYFKSDSLFEMYARAVIKSDDYITFPNFFAKSNKGCEALEEEWAGNTSGLKVACYREASVKFSPNIIKLVSEDMPAVLLGDCDKLMGEGINEQCNTCAATCGKNSAQFMAFAEAACDTDEDSNACKGFKACSALPDSEACNTFKESCSTCISGCSELNWCSPKSDSDANLAALFKELGGELSEELKFVAEDTGYCGVGAINANVKADPAGLLGQVFEDKAFDETAAAPAGKSDLVSLSSYLSNGSVVPEQGAAVTCPEGSSYYRYGQYKKVNRFGDISTFFAFCLQDCVADSECNEAYTCINMDSDICACDPEKPKIDSPLGKIDADCEHSKYYPASEDADPNKHAARFCDPNTNTCGGTVGCFTGNYENGKLVTNGGYWSGRTDPDNEQASSGKSACFSKDTMWNMFGLKGRLNQLRDSMKGN